MNDYKKLNNQPLKLVLAEFRFSPVMQIAGYIPSLQESLRKLYPILNKQGDQLVHVQPDGISLSQTEHWAFIPANRKSTVDISQERLVYATTEYPRFEGFADSCQHALRILAEIVEPALILRIGLRYCDLILIDEGETLSQLVDSQFAPPSSIDSLGATNQHRTDTIIQTATGSLIMRSLYGRHNLTCTPDLLGLPIPIKPDSQPSERIILDFDHIWESKEESATFDVDSIIGKLGELHHTSREAFWKLTSDYARNKKWS